MKKNYEIEILRLIFSVAVVLYHLRIFAGEADFVLFKSGYLAVEFFFILSGYLMAKSAQKAILNKTIENNTTTLGKETAGFILSKIKGFYPYYILAFIFSYVVQHLMRPNVQLSNIFEHIKGALFEALLIRESGLGTNELYYNGVTWYLSVMVIVLFALYPVIRKYKDTALKIIFPLIVLLLGGYMYVTQNAVQVSKWQGLTNWTLIRGVIDISYGVVIFSVCEKLRQLKPTVLTRVLITSFSSALWIYIIGLMFVGYPAKQDFSMIMIIGIAVLFSMSGFSYIGELLSKLKILAYCRNLSLVIYLVHKCAFWIVYYSNLNMGYAESILLCLVLTAALSVISFSLVFIIRTIWKKAKYLFIIKDENAN